MFKFNLKKGFTLLEALVATSILMVAVAAPITIAQKGLSSAVYSKNQMIASYLAQDAIEYIKNVRDTQVIQNNPWLGEFNGCLDNDWCAIDTIKDAGMGEIRQDETEFMNKSISGFYGYESEVGYQKTNFTRKINVKVDPDGNNPDKALITVIVSWGSVENTVTVKTLIYNI